MKAWLRIGLFALLVALPAVSRAQSAAFSFQGQLSDGGKPANGRYDFFFRLFNAATGGNEVAPVVIVSNLGVTNGYFATSLDFGLSAFQGGAGRWVQVEVRTAGTLETYAALQPRTALTPVPVALFALSAPPYPLTATNLPGDVVYLAQLLATNAALRAQAAADLASASNGLSGRLLDTNSALVQLVANEGLLRTNALAAQFAQLLTTSNALSANIAAVTPQLLGASNVFSGSNTFTGAVTATNGNNQFTGAFAGNGAGLSNVTAAGVSAANVSGLLSSGQLPGDVVYLAQLLATNAALRAQAAADLASASNGLSGRLLDTNSVLLQLVANEGLLRTNALAAQFAQLLTTSNALSANIAAVTPQLLGASNVFSGSNTFTGAVTATNGNNQFTGAFLGSGAGLSNVTAAGVTGVLSAAQIPGLDASKVVSGFLDAARLGGAIARSADLLAATNTLRGQMAADKTELLNLLAGLSVTNQAGSDALVGLITTTSNKLAGDLVAANAQLLLQLLTLGSTNDGKNLFTGSNVFSGAVTATNGNNQFTGAFAGSGAGLSNVTAAGVSAANVNGLLSSGQLPGDVVYLAQLLATNAALRAQAAADLASASNGLSGRLLDTNSALVQLVANEGLLRTNALAAQLAQLLTTSNALSANIAAVTPRLLGASNVFTGSNTFTGAVTATNGSNQFTGAFAGNGAGLSNVTAAGVSAANVSGLLSSGQLPGDVVYLTKLLSVSNALANQVIATNNALSALLGTDFNAAIASISGTLLTQLVSSNVTFTGSNTFSGAVTATNGSNQFSGSFAGDGAGLVKVPVNGLVGILNAAQLPADLIYGAQLLVGTTNTPVRGLNLLGTNDVVVPLKLSSVLNTNSLAAYDVILGGTRMTNLFEASSGVVSNTLSVDAVGRLSLARGGQPAQALAHFGGRTLNDLTTNNAFLQFDSMVPDRQGAWLLTHGYGFNYTDPRPNKYWSWGFNHGRNGKQDQREPSLHMNMETWWEPWPGASDQDHQIELYWQYSNFENTFGMRPWGLVLRGSNYIQNHINVDRFTIGSGDGKVADLFTISPRRAPLQGALASLQGVFEIFPGDPMGGLIYLNNSGFLMASGSEGTANLLRIDFINGEFQIGGQTSPFTPDSGLLETGFTYHRFEPRYPTNVTMTVFGVPGQSTNLMEFADFRGSGNPALASISSAGVMKATGFRVGSAMGLTTNVPFLSPAGVTNTLIFSGGILVDVRSGVVP